MVESVTTIWYVMVAMLAIELSENVLMFLGLQMGY